MLARQVNAKREGKVQAAAALANVRHPPAAFTVRRLAARRQSKARLLAALHEGRCGCIVVGCGRRGFASRRCPARADDTAVNHKERAATSPWKPVTPRRIPACSGSSPASPWCMSRGPSPYPLRHQRHVHRQQDRVARHGCRGDASRWKTPTCIGYQILFSMGITKGKWSTLTELLATCEGPALRDGGAQAPGD
jgi:hypothetical protein